MPRLKILKEPPRKTRREAFQEAAQKKWNAYWADPPAQNAAEKMRLQRLEDLLCAHLADRKIEKAIDLGAGAGELAWLLKQRGVEVTALDVSEKALLFCEKRGVRILRGCLPYLNFPDHVFALILCTDVIAELDESLYRLLLSELERVLQREGRLLISTPLDVHSVDALGRFITLVETEFEILEARFTYNRLYDKFFLRSKSGVLHAILERISETLFGEGGMTHVACVCKKKALF